MSFKTMTAFHTHHLQQDEVSLALRITSPTITNTHQYICKAASSYKKPDLTATDAEGWRIQKESCDTDLTSALILHTALQKSHMLYVPRRVPVSPPALTA